MPVEIKFLHPAVTWDHVGMIADWLSPSNSASARDQLDQAYGHGGGWQPFKGFSLRPDNSIKYPGDPSMKPIAEMQLRDELILQYEHAWVAIVQPDRSFEICRMD